MERNLQNKYKSLLFQLSRIMAVTSFSQPLTLNLPTTTIVA